MAKLKRPVVATYETSDAAKGRDPYDGRPYSSINPNGAPKPTHPCLNVPGSGTREWDAQLERWVVYA